MADIKRNHFIDVLKGVCIIFVVFTHYAWTDSERLKLLFPFWIDMAVPLFMIISGYVYTKSYNKNCVECFSEAYDINNISKKLVRYTNPFVIIFFLELLCQHYLIGQKISVAGGG